MDLNQMYKQIYEGEHGNYYQKGAHFIIEKLDNENEIEKIKIFMSKSLANKKFVIYHVIKCYPTFSWNILNDNNFYEMVKDHPKIKELPIAEYNINM